MPISKTIQSLDKHLSRVVGLAASLSLGASRRLCRSNTRLMSLTCTVTS